jgi:hypothetical protein
MGLQKASVEKHNMRFRFNLQSIPVLLAALGLWAVIGGWYIAILPVNLAGGDNIGLVLSILGLCLFLADRLAFLWLRIDCWVIVFKVWVWGLIIIAWGLLVWLHSFSEKSLSIFIPHWLVIIAVILVTSFWVKRRRSPGE